MKAFRLTSNTTSSFLKNALKTNPIRATFSDRFRDKELAEEKFYFDKQDSRLAQQLLKKLKKDKKPIDEESYKQIERLRKLLDAHHEKFSEALIDDILEWKKEEHH